MTRQSPRKTPLSIFKSPSIPQYESLLRSSQKRSLDRQPRGTEESVSRERSAKNGKQEDFRSKKFINFGSYGNEASAISFINENNDPNLLTGMPYSNYLYKMNLMEQPIEGMSLISPLAIKGCATRKDHSDARRAGETSPKIKPFFTGFDVSLRPSSPSKRQMMVKRNSSRSEFFADEELSLISPLHLNKIKPIQRESSKNERYTSHSS